MKESIKYINKYSSKGNIINDSMVGDLVILLREDAVELVSNFKVARATGLRRGGAPNADVTR